MRRDLLKPLPEGRQGEEKKKRSGSEHEKGGVKENRYDGARRGGLAYKTYGSRKGRAAEPE